MVDLIRHHSIIFAAHGTKKIDSILRCLNRIQQRLPETEADFIKDYDAQDVVVLNLQGNRAMICFFRRSIRRDSGRSNKRGAFVGAG